MSFTKITLASIAVSLVSGYLVAPPGTAAPGTTDSCSKWVMAISGMTCEMVESAYGITEADFESWVSIHRHPNRLSIGLTEPAKNPFTLQVGSGCNLAVGFDYCTQINFAGASTTTATTVPTSTTGNGNGNGNGISTPTPTQGGMATNCNSFHLVKDGDTCASIASGAGITLANFYAWNSGVGSGCSSLWLGYYVCTGVQGSTAPTATQTTTTTTAGNGISTPTPTQGGMTTKCNAFHLVKEGDTCASIASAAGITLGDFNAWNPGAGSGCSSLWLGYYVCIGVIGGSGSGSNTMTTKTTTTTPGNGVSTPTPTQAGIAANCDKFHLVGKGDNCASISSEAGITLAQFNSWNTGVGSGCSSLWLGYYVCVGVIGGSPTTKATSVTTPGNGVQTPTPPQAGMVGNCNEFYKVGSGDTCAAIAKEEGVTIANIEKWNPGVGSACKSLWLGYYICVGVI